MPNESAGPRSRYGGVGREFGKLDQAAQWWVGDWWAFGEKHYGDRMALVESEDWTGPAFQTCVDCATTCRAFESTSRRVLLSFKHHRTLAALKLNPELVESLLDWCEAPLPIESAAAVRKVVLRACRNAIANRNASGRQICRAVASARVSALLFPSLGRASY